MEESSIIDDAQKLDKILDIIEFEIQFATDQINSLKKDNLTLILLFFTLIGFLWLIPIDVFVYKWFTLGLINLILYSCLYLSLNYFYRKNSCSKFNDYIKIISNENRDNCTKHAKCSECECFNTCVINADENKKNEFMENMKPHIFFYYLFITSTLFKTLTVIFITIFISYFYGILSFSADNSFNLYEPNTVIVVLLLLECGLFAFYLLYHEKFNELKMSCKSKKIYIFIIVLILLSITIAVFGYTSSIPPFILISDNLQIANELLEHYQSISSFSIYLLLFLFQTILFIVMNDQFNSALIIENLNEKISKLTEIKTRINLFQLSNFTPLDVNQLFKEVIWAKMPSYEYISIIGIFSIPYIQHNLTPDEIILLIRGS